MTASALFEGSGAPPHAMHDPEVGIIEPDDLALARLAVHASIASWSTDRSNSADPT